ncbi:hypothetical protein COU87_01115 [Candidatus Roizmanbacteria bacterium CG10_big_fil_rev_8_21_14_0_10_39_12]|uniref:Uncharacterized protein n=1 Tax=Candidatus Roizmanbacteria bacterium CG10_big_fil_rev_8_21_14_0_10_39_12 TaxID=1974852 RepID=A0A2M8KQC2_9BACT|nr:MAG: hypothetical protein COU87_01115 [Candidatus Roizmanbacteria bacterium CG10_big_fil_rev_8_21_14_0_10_39_12]
MITVEIIKYGEKCLVAARGLACPPLEGTSDLSNPPAKSVVIIPKSSDSFPAEPRLMYHARRRGLGKNPRGLLFGILAGRVK